MKNGPSNGFLTVLVALAAIALYLPTLRYGFVYDSSAQVLIDPFIHQPRHWIDILSLRVMGMDVLDANRPVALASLMVDAALWGFNPAGYHLQNLLLHGAVVALLFRLLLGFSGSRGAALVGSLLFAAHPLLVEAVAEPSFREDLLVAFFTLLALWLATRLRGGRPRWAAAGVVGALFLAVGSKESGVAGVAVVAAYALLFRRGRGEGRFWLGLLAVAAGVCGAFLYARFRLEPEVSLIFTQKPQPIASDAWALFATQCRIWSAEWLRILWPSDLCADYGPYHLRNLPRALGLGIVAGVVAVEAALAWRSRGVALACALFWFSLLPVSNFIPMYRPMADRFLYLPLTGVALATALGLAWASRRWPRARWAVLGAAALAIAPLGAATTRQMAHWDNELTLWTHAVAINPFSETAQINLGFALYNEGRLEEAIPPLQRAAELTKGAYAPPFAAFALVAAAQGRTTDAARALAKAAELDSRYREPETLVSALTLPPAQAARLRVILLSSSL